MISFITELMNKEGTKMAKKKGNEMVKAVAGASKVAECTCEHSYQDERYGKRMRVKICQATGAWECSVCGRA